MKALQAIIFTLTFTHCISQVVRLEAHNPVPRKGEDISITYRVEWPSETPAISESKKYNAKGELTLSDYTSDLGKFVIGPISFVINGQVFKSDSISIEVFPELPNRKNGLWTRYVQFGGKHYLITEQRIGGEWKQTRENKNSISMTFNSEGIEFATLTEHSIMIDDAKFQFNYSSSKSQELTGEGIIGTETVHYKMFVYNITIPEGHTKSVVIQKKHFTNFPKGVDFEPIVIK